MAQAGSLHRLHRLRADRRDHLLAVLRDHRQDHALRPVARDRREAEPRPGLVVAAMCLGISLIVAAAMRVARAGCPCSRGLNGLSLPEPAAAATPRQVQICAAGQRVHHRRLRPAVRAGGRYRELPAGRFGAAVLHHHRRLPVRDGRGSYLSRFFERQLPHAHFLRIELLVALAGGLLPVLLFLAHALHARRVPAGAVRAGVCGRHAGGAGDPAGDAHPQAQRRAERPGVAGADLRLPGRAGGVGGVSAAAGAAPRHDPHRAAVRPDERRGGGVGAVAVPARAATLRRARRGLRRHLAVLAGGDGPPPARSPR